MNKVFLIGRITNDLELSHTKAGKANVSFSLAVDKNLSRDKRKELEDAGRPTADFPRIVAWGYQAENLVRYCGRGSQVAIDGRIQTGSYEDKESGKMIYTTDIIADYVEFLSKSTQEGSKGGQDVNTYQNNNNSDEDFFEDDFSEIEDDQRIPF
uniref:single-stranded DNA-binding protein n=2 Tax=Anaerococcus mediterraneensis TaxID=1870984 RepID=UPI000931A91F|nr:single-stranded DNA-binding protein [Anaerococcus mediterraneensis]